MRKNTFQWGRTHLFTGWISDMARAQLWIRHESFQWGMAHSCMTSLRHMGHYSSTPLCMRHDSSRWGVTYSYTTWLSHTGHYPSPQNTTHPCRHTTHPCQTRLTHAAHTRSHVACLMNDSPWKANNDVHTHVTVLYSSLIETHPATITHLPTPCQRHTPYSPSLPFFSQSLLSLSLSLSLHSHSRVV